MSKTYKSRHKRLPISGTLGAAPKWNPTDDDWNRFTAGYGNALFDATMRNEIVGAVEKYFWWASAEGSAPFATDKGGAIKKLRLASRLAHELEGVVSSLGDAEGMLAPHWEIYFPSPKYSDDVLPAGASDVELYERIMALPALPYHRDLGETVHVIASVIDDARRYIDDSPGFEEGYEWGLLVRNLARIFERRALKVSASNDSRGQISPFVQFFKAVQSTFPVDLRRHETDSALSKAIQQQLVKKRELAKTGSFGGKRVR